MSFNYTLSQISKEDLEFIIANGKRYSELDGFEFESAIHFSYKFIKEIIPNLIKNANFEKLIAKCFNDRGIGFFENEVSYLDHKKLLGFILWIKDEMEAIITLENTYLSSEPDVDMQSAGIKELDQFGNINTIDQLAGGDVTKWKEIESLPYSVVFDKLYKTKIENQIQRKLGDIMKNKNKK